ncbi:MAG: YbhB/YbcL family Raf kinase inhibitor-like protein [Deltaproteobacteria bacterium]|nr:YbhB/YbcL family Raf kinase inhibitor-like protein [Deltaproteobacteria bacterium]
MKTLALLFALAACSHESSLAVTSTAFTNGGEIPTDFTCEGPDQQPALTWTGAPAATKAYAVIVDDPDAPAKTWVHLVAVTSATSLGSGMTYGTNDFGKAAWGGPCPPSGRHHYHFKVYALDAPVGTPGVTKDDLLAQMKGHVLAQGELVGTYEKKHGG